MLACYEIDPSDREGFLDLLRETERVYRDESVLTEGPILRAESLESPGLIVELIEWRSAKVLGAVMENEPIQVKWSEIKARWKRGDFPIGELPEADVPWSVLRSLS
jgi:hypothetical protein